MTVILNDPSLWPLINANLIASYFVVAASAGAMYDWVLTLGQEVELIWRQRWSLMTFLYLSVRYGGIGYAAMYMLVNVPTISMTDVVSLITYDALNCRSRKLLIYIVVIFLATKIADVVILAMLTMQMSGAEYILSGIHQCMIDYAGDSYSWLPWFQYLTLYGRSLHCVSRSGSL
ncbi:hypothetical protein BD769DRAFT_69076 [Suillus cothurnatus]|nr:hypothetical protein BD769DRAFT_69076 [Suillus cothurnatus]